MTRDQDQLQLPKLPFVFNFTINKNWKEAYNLCREDKCFSKELSDYKEDLKTIIQSVAIIFTNCSPKKLYFLAKAYMLLAHAFDSNEWNNHEDVKSKVNYLNECFNAFQNNDDRKLHNLSPYFYNLSKLFKDFKAEQYSTIAGDDEFEIDLMSFIENLNKMILEIENVHEELYCSMESLNLEEKIKSFLSHNINEFGLILTELFFDKKMICDKIEQDRDYKELKYTVSMAINLISEIYEFPMCKLYSQLETNFIGKLVNWFKITTAQAILLAPDYVDELLQKFDYLSGKLVDTHKYSNEIKNYLDFWKKLYTAAVFYTTQSATYSKFFPHQIKYKFLEKFNID